MIENFSLPPDDSEYENQVDANIDGSPDASVRNDLSKDIGNAAIEQATQDIDDVLFPPIKVLKVPETNDDSGTDQKVPRPGPDKVDEVITHAAAEEQEGQETQDPSVAQSLHPDDSREVTHDEADEQNGAEHSRPSVEVGNGTESQNGDTSQTNESDVPLDDQSEIDAEFDQLLVAGWNDQDDQNTSEGPGDEQLNKILRERYGRTAEQQTVLWKAYRHAKQVRDDAERKYAEVDAGTPDNATPEQIEQVKRTEQELKSALWAYGTTMEQLHPDADIPIPDETALDEEQAKGGSTVDKVARGNDKPGVDVTETDDKQRNLQEAENQYATAMDDYSRTVAETPETDYPGSIEEETEDAHYEARLNEAGEAALNAMESYDGALTDEETPDDEPEAPDYLDNPYMNLLESKEALFEASQEYFGNLKDISDFEGSAGTADDDITELTEAWQAYDDAKDAHGRFLADYNLPTIETAGHDGNDEADNGEHPDEDMTTFDDGDSNNDETRGGSEENGDELQALEDTIQLAFHGDTFELYDEPEESFTGEFRRQRAFDHIADSNAEVTEFRRLVELKDADNHFIRVVWNDEKFYQMSLPSGEISRSEGAIITDMAEWGQALAEIKHALHAVADNKFF